VKEYKIPGRWLAGIIITALLVVSALPLLSPITAEASVPAPTNVSPAAFATIDISLVHTFRSSDFPDIPDPLNPKEKDKHYASQWQIATKSQAYRDPLFLVYDSGVDTSNLTTNTILPGCLIVNTTYYWHVRHQDFHGDWSDWSSETSFKTIVSGKPSRPINISPADGSTHISLIPTLQSSNFVSLDGGASQIASQWQITTKSGDYSSPVYDSGIDTSNLSKIAIGKGYLNVNTTY
jgi:hypothetical protein